VPVAKKSAKVKPHDVASATIAISRQPTRAGRRNPSAAATATATTTPSGRPTSDAAPADARGGHAMGRGRAKAKQTKVARELKYYSPDTDLSALERELHGTAQSGGRATSDDRDREDEDDYGQWSSGRR